MRVNNLKEVVEIIGIKEKVEKIFSENLTVEEAKTLKESSELFWDIMAETLDKVV
jgi:hypothetical protein